MTEAGRRRFLPLTIAVIVLVAVAALENGAPTRSVGPGRDLRARQGAVHREQRRLTSTAPLGHPRARRPTVRARVASRSKRRR